MAGGIFATRVCFQDAVCAHGLAGGNHVYQSRLAQCIQRPNAVIDKMLAEEQKKPAKYKPKGTQPASVPLLPPSSTIMNNECTTLPAATFHDTLLQLDTEKMSSAAVEQFEAILCEPSTERWLQLVKYANLYELVSPDEFLVTLREQHGDGLVTSFTSLDDLFAAYLDLEFAQRMADERKIWWGTIADIFLLAIMLLMFGGIFVMLWKSLNV